MLEVRVGNLEAQRAISPTRVFRRPADQPILQQRRRLLPDDERLMEFIDHSTFPAKIYPITDTRISGLSHVEQVERLIAAGARSYNSAIRYACRASLYDTRWNVIHSNAHATASESSSTTE